MQAQLVLAVVAGFLAPAPQDAKDKEAIQGTWVVVSAERDGKAIDDAKGGKVTFKDGTVTIKTKDEEQKGTYKIDASKKPKTIDVTEGDKTGFLPGIYTLEGDTLKICLPRKPGNKRPTELTSKSGSGCMVIELKREKN